MLNFTQKTSSWLTSLVMMLMFAVAGSASAIDFGPNPLKIDTKSLNGKYNVELKTCSASNMPVNLADPFSITLVDAAGSAVKGAIVKAEIENSFVLALEVVGADAQASGAFKILVPAGVICLAYMETTVNDAFEVELNCTPTAVDPGETVDPEKPEVKANEATFTFDNYRGEQSRYFYANDVVKSDAKGVVLTFDNVGMENATYSYSYISSSKYLQFKDCAFTISAPAGVKIQKIVFEDAAPESTTYELDNLEAAGYSYGVWTGNSQAVKFTTKIISTPIYGYDEDDEEYISGYIQVASGIRASKVYVVLDSELPREESTEIAPVDPVTPVDPVEPVEPDTPVDPTPDANTAVFNYASGTIPTSINGVTAMTTSTYAEGEFGFGLQLKEGATLSFTAPQDCVLTSVELVKGEDAPYNLGYLEMTVDDYETVDGVYNDILWTGRSKTVTFVSTVITAWVGKAIVKFDKASGAEGIQTVATDKANAAIYDLSGRRVSAAAQKGIFVVGGKKVVR